MAVSLVARCHHETLDRSRLAAARLKHVVGPADVGLERQERSVERDPDERLRAEVEHDRRAALGDRALDIGDGLEVAVRHGDPLDVAAPEQL